MSVIIRLPLRYCRFVNETKENERSWCRNKCHHSYHCYQWEVVLIKPTTTSIFTKSLRKSCYLRKFSHSWWRASNSQILICILLFPTQPTSMLINSNLAIKREKNSQEKSAYRDECGENGPVIDAQKKRKTFHFKNETTININASVLLWLLPLLLPTVAVCHIVALLLRDL